LATNRWIFAATILVIILSLPVVVHAVSWNSPIQLTSDSITHVQPRISLDGTRIVYMANPPTYGTFQIFAINSNGSGVRQLTANTGSNFVPYTNGNGTLVVFFSDMSGSFQVYKVKSDGTGLTQLTFPPPSAPKAVSNYPVISSDGSRIVFQSNRTGLMEMFAINSDGSGLTQLTANNAIHEHASVSGDGKMVTFDSDATTAGNREVFMVNSNGTGLHQLTFNSADNYAPAMSADGRYVAFQSNSTGHYEIWLIGTSGSGLRQLTFDTVDDQSPAINYDGSIIAYQTTVSGSSQVKIIIPATGEVDQLTSNLDNNYAPSINGAGTYVTYQGNVAGFTQLFLVTQVPTAVGGSNVPVDKLALLAPLLVISVIAGSIGGAVFYARHRRRPSTSQSLIPGSYHLRL
jgi:TolB protein